MGKIADWRMNGIYKANPDKVANEIKSIQKNNASKDATARQIVDYAEKNEKSELHKCFDWDNEIAGDKWRLHQARNITYQLVIHKEEEEERPSIRFFVKSNNEDGYKETLKVIRNKDEYESLLQRAYAELQVFKKKYETLSELQEIFDLIP